MTGWLAVHIFYSANPSPLLTDCVEPLVRDLTRCGLIDRWFFVRYWVEGPHIRLRLRPTGEAAADEVRSRTDKALDHFLRVRPAVYDLRADALTMRHKELYLAEYSGVRWTRTYGESDTIPLRPNNSFDYYPYHPEYERYGGPDGVDRAERHFHESSALVLHLLKNRNLHLRPILLGTSAQLMASAVTTVLGPDPHLAARYFLDYSTYWETTFLPPDPTRRARYDACRALPRIPIGPTLAWPHLPNPTLLRSYLHMTNNRLGLSIGQEVYLSRLLHRAMRPPTTIE